MPAFFYPIASKLYAFYEYKCIEIEVTRYTRSR